MKLLCPALATVVLLVSATPRTAVAQESDGAAAVKPIPVQRVKPKRTFEPEREEKVFERYAECIVSKEHRLGTTLRQYLRAPVNGAVPPNVVKKLVDSQCLGKGTGQMWMSRDLYRQTLYAALYRREFGSSEPADFVPAVSYDAEFDAAHLPLSDRQVAMRRLGDCAVSRDLSSAHDFTVAKVRSDEEQARLSAVVQALSQCIGNGEQIEFTRPALKGILAESLYKYRSGTTQTELASAQ